MTTDHIILLIVTIGLSWAVGGSIAALFICYRWKRQTEREAMQCRFDPMATRGIERGDGLYRVTKETRKEKKYA